MLREKVSLYKLALAAECFILLVLLFRCFGKEEMVFSLAGEDILKNRMQQEGPAEFQGERFTLLPGVYQVRLRTNPAKGQRIYVAVECDVSGYKALRCNGIEIPAEEDYTEFEVYVADEVSSAYIHCSFPETAGDGIVNLEVWRTKAGNRIWLFLALLCFGTADFLILLRRRILGETVTRRQQAVFWGLAGVVLLAYFPYLTDYVILGTDSDFYLCRISALADVLRRGTTAAAGQQGAWLCGHGYKTPVFYGSLFLVIPALLQLVGFSVMSAYKIFVLLGITAAAVIAWRSFYRCVRDEYAALAGAAAWLLVPYHLYVRYNTGGVGEAMAMAFLPMVCCGMYLLYTGEVTEREYRRYKWYLAIGMAGVLQGHLITAEMTLVLTAGLCLLFWRKTLRRETIRQLLGAAGIGLAISLFISLPMLYVMRTDACSLQGVIGETVQDEGVSLTGFFRLLPEKGGANPGGPGAAPVHIGAGVLMLLLLYAVRGFLEKTEGARGGCRMCRLCGSLTVVLLGLSSRYFPWDVLQRIPGVGSGLAFLRFPSRWMALAAVAAAMFTAFFVRWMEREAGRLVRLGAVLSIVVLLGSGIYQGNSIAFESEACRIYNIEELDNNAGGKEIP